MFRSYVRCVVVSVILLFGLSVRPATCDEQNTRDDVLGALLEEIQNVQRTLPTGSIIGANVISRDGRWYVARASEISALRTILKEATPDHDDSWITPPQRLLPEYSIVLWGVADGKVVPLQVLWVTPLPLS